MKKIILLIVVLSPFFMNAQDEAYKEHVQAILTGNSGFLSSHMTEEVDLAILDDEDLYEKSEAISKIQTFFNSLDGMNGFDLKHQGTSKLNHQYYVGDLKMDSGTNYRMTFFLKEISSVLQITQIRIEEF